MPNKRGAKKQSTPPALDPVVAELSADEAKIKRLEAEIKKLTRQLYRDNTSMARILEAVETHLAEPQIVNVRPKPRANRSRKPERVCLVHVSDIQLGKRTKSYNPSVAYTRVAEMLPDAIDGLVAEQRMHHKVDECVLLLGGDIVEGESIFPGQASEIVNGVVQQACWDFPRIGLELISRLAATFPKVRVSCVRGNHGKLGKFFGKDSNVDTIAYRCLELAMLGTDLSKRVSIDVNPESFCDVVDILGWGFLHLHGDQIRGQLGFPWYGVGKKVAGWIDSIKQALIEYGEQDGMPVERIRMVAQSWDYLLFGHFHTPAHFRVGDREVMCNGTTESDNEYARESMAACGDPAQRVGFVSRKHGYVADHLVHLSEHGRLSQYEQRKLEVMHREGWAKGAA